MHISIDRDELLKSLGKVKSVVERRAAIETFEYVKIDIINSVMYLTAVDSDMMITDAFSINSSEQQISFTTLAHMLYEIIRRIYDSNKVTFILDKEDVLIVESGGSRFEIPCIPPNKFPSFNANVQGGSCEIAAVDLRFLLLNTKHAISIGEPRYYLNGAYLHTVSADDSSNNGSTSLGDNNKNDNDNNNNNVDKNLLRIVATDTHRLSFAEVKHKQSADDNSTEPLNAILTRKIVTELIKLLEEIDDSYNIKIVFNAARIMFTIQNTRLIAKLIDAKFPAYGSAIQVIGDKSLVINSDDLRKSIDLVNAISDGKTKEMKFHIDQNSVCITMSNTVLHNSTATQRIDATFNNDEPIDILLNSKYVMDCLNIVHSEKVEFVIKDAFGPVMIREYQREGNDGLVHMSADVDNTNKKETNSDKDNRQSDNDTANCSAARCNHILMPMRIKYEDSHK